MASEDLATTWHALRAASPGIRARDAADQVENIMISVGNRGCEQVFSGPIKRVVRHGPWLDVLDPEFNLYLRTDRIASSWRARRRSAVARHARPADRGSAMKIPTRGLASIAGEAGLHAGGW
jgi:putative heme degradation protein